MEYATAALSILKFLFDLSVTDLGDPQWVEGKGEYAITREVRLTQTLIWRSRSAGFLNTARR